MQDCRQTAPALLILRYSFFLLRSSIVSGDGMKTSILLNPIFIFFWRHEILRIRIRIVCSPNLNQWEKFSFNVANALHEKQFLLKGANHFGGLSDARGKWQVYLVFLLRACCISISTIYTCLMHIQWRKCSSSICKQ